VLPELKAEIQVEIDQLSKLLKDFIPLLLKSKDTFPDTIEKTALAGMLHSFYNGIENILKRIYLHQYKVSPKGENWHTVLLQKMTKTNENSQGMMSEELRIRLKTYMEFRHVFRHAYSFELQWKKMAPLAFNCEDVFKQFQKELNLSD
jgi:hypothetical protein